MTFVQFLIWFNFSFQKYILYIAFYWNRCVVQKHLQYLKVAVWGYPISVYLFYLKIFAIKGEINFHFSLIISKYFTWICLILTCVNTGSNTTKPIWKSERVQHNFVIGYIANEHISFFMFINLYVTKLCWTLSLWDIRFVVYHTIMW